MTNILFPPFLLIILFKSLLRYQENYSVLTEYNKCVLP